MRRKNKRAKLVALIFSLLLIGIGYAYLSANLKITGTAKIRDAKWDVHFENAKKEYATDTVTFDSNSNSNLAQGIPVIKGEDNTELEWNVTLNQPGDGYVISSDIVNAGDIDAVLDIENSTFELKLGDEENITSIPLKEFKKTIRFQDDTIYRTAFITSIGPLEINIIPLTGNFGYLNASERINFGLSVGINKETITNSEWDSLRGNNLTLTFNLKYLQKGLDNISSSNSNSNEVFSVRYDNAQFKGASATTTFPNNVNIPTIANSMYDEDVPISYHNIEYSVIFNQPGDYYEFTMDFVNDGDYDAAPAYVDNYKNKIKIGDGEEQEFPLFDELPSELEDIFEYSVTSEAEEGYGAYFVSRGKTNEVLVKIKLKDDVTPEQLALVQGKVIKINYELFRIIDVPQNMATK